MNPLTRISFEVPGEPVAKERPRTNMATGVVYTPAKTKNYEETVKWCYQMAAHAAVHAGCGLSAHPQEREREEKEPDARWSTAANNKAGLG